MREGRSPLVRTWPGFPAAGCAEADSLAAPRPAKEGAAHERHRVGWKSASGIATLTLNRPQALNALSVEMMQALRLGAGARRRRCGGAGDRHPGRRRAFHGRRRHQGLPRPPQASTRWRVCRPSRR
ncbi:MAG: hypothetical protein MZW92_13335 [Comamonadaceae bacterium]|nr:hypothetical protein [Comamonadaceae bacterium]